MLLENVKDDAAGATVLFLGTVRNHNNEYAVSGIYYEAYAKMAYETMAKIEAEAIKRWKLKKFAAVHRIGDLKIGEVSVAIAVSSEHRGLKPLKQEGMRLTESRLKFRYGRRR